MKAGDDGPSLARVAVPVPTRRIFTYQVPAGARGAMRAGARVLVSLGRRRVVGTIVEWPAPIPDGDVQLRPIDRVLEGAPAPDPAILSLTRFVSEYYLCSWGEAIEAALPPDPGPRATRKVVSRAPGADPSLLPERATARRRVLDALPEDGTPVPLGRLGEAGRRVVPALVRLGLLRVENRRDPEPEPVPAAVTSEVGPPLTAAQESVLEPLLRAVESERFAPHLLFGATGSGKTEVYLAAARKALSRGRGVLYLVPEIGLTPILVSRLERRFPGQLAVLHSGLTPRERHDAWEAVRVGARRFAIGARSAIFAPVGNLGLVIVDEEHDPSYKQQDSPRYNARDLAVVRAREQGAALVLGSATPSLESFQNARSGRYVLLSLGGRVHDRPLPTVRIVDMRDEFRRRGRVQPLSALLVEELRQCLLRGEQALVLRNRRGWATALLCPSCGIRSSCPRCSVALTWHERDRRLRCHYCGFETGRPKLCTECGSIELNQLGEGSERIEHELRGLLPDARIARMDRDTVRGRGAHEKILTRFERGEIDVLVGTQMIAKGHDFPRVTVVGVLSADQTLGLPDFRAAERTFQLLTQVAGRAGRAQAPGTVIVQAFDPAHPVLAEAAAQDYERFFEREIRYRRALRYPPLAALVQLLVTDKSASRAAEWAEEVAGALRREGEGRLLVAGPGPAPVERIQEKYRQQILVRSAGRRRLVAAVEQALAATEKTVPRRAILVDVDPVSLL